ncbi:Protein POLYCHOME [Vitis vinifera]|uniref:Protein POLYCHOME n=1 Tax=Vitis vinifera TaxID=29760 RepID=A0A438JL34_VITVI|nr:Protein POLYCHOME [Vitis vinifera]
MPESRDRLSRPEDIAELFLRRRSGILGILADGSERSSNLFASPSRRETTTRTTTLGARGATGILASRGVGWEGRLWNPKNRKWTWPWPGCVPIASVWSREYPGNRKWSARKRSFRKFRVAILAIERRRARLREIDGQQIDIPIPQDISDVHDPILPPSSAQLEQDISMISPSPTSGMKLVPKAVGKVPKILLDITDQTGGGSDFLTPQKKLLNSIDTVEKAVMDELGKLKRTPSAKRAEQRKGYAL